MAMQLELVEADDDAQWDALVDASPQGTVFSKTAFLRSLNKPFRRFQVRSQGKVLAQIAAVEDESGRRIIQADFTPYQGILFAPAPAGTLPRQRVLDEFRLTEFLIVALCARYAEVAACLSWHVTDVRPFLWHNYHAPALGQFKVQPRYTAVLDLQVAADEVITGQARACRRQEWRKGAAFHVDREADVNVFLDLYARTFARQGIALPQATLDLVRSIATAALDGGYGALSGCVTPQGMASMNLFLFDATRAYYLFAANDPDLRNTGAASKLMFENIFDARARGMRELDFVGANSPNRADFKLSFNPELKPYFDVRYTGPAA
ncbi:MAG: GNAT family N-acetyltransferase [Massilia sp.]